MNVENFQNLIMPLQFPSSSWMWCNVEDNTLNLKPYLNLNFGFRYLNWFIFSCGALHILLLYFAEKCLGMCLRWRCCRSLFVLYSRVECVLSRLWAQSIRWMSFLDSFSALPIIVPLPSHHVARQLFSWLGWPQDWISKEKKRATCLGPSRYTWRSWQAVTERRSYPRAPLKTSSLKLFALKKHSNMRAESPMW